ncbi:nitroreductase family deazaflavin-dependent oxidoreductase [Hamadaea sp. NPDC050747]|uniref:nitroreductase family deazaflavin-dependent oxidoreductase n=1 Tax=Hamadaea sp. NPDC050747 TaxID=3155789 RepID=UPI0033CA1058
MTEEIVDSPVGWVAKHINSYVDSDGGRGHEYYGVNALLLTTRGRKSGKLRRTALYYATRGDDVVLIASNGGSVGHPLWYRNLTADPNVTLQVKDDVYAAVARTAEGAERAELWDLMVGVFPKYAEYQAKVEREIPVVVLTRTAG